MAIEAAKLIVEIAADVLNLTKGLGTAVGVTNVGPGEGEVTADHVERTVAEDALEGENVTPFLRYWMAKV